MTFSSITAQNFLSEYDYLVARLTVMSKMLKDLSQYESIRQNIISLASSDLGLPIEVNFFGSRIIGVATDESDLDIYVCIDKKVYQMYSKSSEQQDRLQKLKRALQSSQSWNIKDQAMNTAVPVLFTVYKPMNLDCDISVTNGVATQNSKLIAHLFNIQPEAVSLVHFVKMWLKMQGFDQLKGYTITLLVLFYLQSKNTMPTCEVVQRNLRKEKIDGWEVQFDPNRSLIDYNTDKMISYKHHVKGFFQFYKSFDYFRVMSTYNGKQIPSRTYKASYPKFLQKGIYIVGPVNRGKNCGIIDECYKHDFIHLCKSSFDFLKYIEL